jgi:biopolymer transport protein ExbD
MFFIVASLAMVVQNGLPVNLPKASTGERHSAQNLTITIDRAGNLHLNTTPITLANETEQLKKLGVSSGTMLIINADYHVEHGVVTTVMDDARKAGIERFAIATAS